MTYTAHQQAQLQRLGQLLDPSPDNPHALSIFGPSLSRAEARAIPLMRVLVPSFDAPMLAFDDEDQGMASVLYADLKLLWEQWQRRGDPKSRRRIAIQARRTWARLIELSIGVQVTHARWPSVVLFAD